LNREDLVRSLVHYVAAGKLDARVVDQVLRSLGGGEAPPAAGGDLLEALLEIEGPSARLLTAQLRDALAHFGFRSKGQPVPEEVRNSLRDLPSDLPLGWLASENVQGRVRRALALLADRLFFEPHREQAPALGVALEKQYQEAVAVALGDSSTTEPSTLLEVFAEAERQMAEGPDRATILAALKGSLEKALQSAARAVEKALSQPEQPLPVDLDPDLLFEQVKARFPQSPARGEQQRLLDRVCAWPTQKVAALLVDLPMEPWAQERASLVLTLRFGQPAVTTWEGWRIWLRGQLGIRSLSGEGTRVGVRRSPLPLLYLWYSRQPDADPGVLAAMQRRVMDRLEPVTMTAFVDRWADALSPEEYQALTGETIQILEVTTVVAPKPTILLPPAPAPAVVRAPDPPKIVPPRPPPKPSVWDVHVKPFFLENWYMVAGVMMVLVGSSLLAYYTWDKSLLLRYTLMPAMLGGITGALAWVGGWIERRDSQFKDTGAVLRGAAIALLPVNFMAVALLANESPQQVHKAVFVPLMGATYLALFGWGLRRWCASVHEGLGGMLGGTLLFINSLVTVAPLARAISGVNPEQVLPIVGTGFYLGFAALAVAVVRFTRRLLNVDLAKDKRVVWFFGATLAVTFLQVFAWVHGYLKHLPHVYTYAPMVVLAGGLVLYTERRALLLRGEGERHGAESFLGFAFILLGVLMGIGHPALRIATFILAGAVWIASTTTRKHPLHAWIGLTLATFGGASIGLLQGFPVAYVPSLGIGIALGLGLYASMSRASDLLSTAAAGMQAAVLILTAIVTMLAQARSGSNPMIAAGHLAAVAALFGVRAWRDQKIRWAQTAMVVLALSLPYVAGLDLKQQVLHSTTLVFGLAVLSLLWIGLTLVRKSPVLLGARSTVLWIYGVLALVCMTLRATLDADAGMDRAAFDLGGPLLMTLALVWAGWFSRSLIPSGMAMLIGLVLFPELRDRLQQAYPNIAWGSGLGSAITAFGLTLVSFRLRALPSLQKLEGGDRYLGETPYPFLRRDYTLFTLPMIATAIFLTAKVETWNFFRQLDHGEMGLKVAAAMVVSGATWTLLGVYLRAYPLAKIVPYLGLLAMEVGIAFGTPHVLNNPDAATIALLPALWAQGLYFLYRFGLQPRADWAAGLLTTPTRRILKLQSLLYALPCIAAYVLDRKPEGPLAMLTTWTALELAWHGLASKRKVFGYFLVVLDWSALLAWVVHQPGFDHGTEGAIVASLSLVLLIQVFQAALEFRKPWYEFLKPLLVPFQVLCSVSVAVLGVLAVVRTFQGEASTTLVYGLTLVALLLTARSLSSGVFALLALLVWYCLLHGKSLDNLLPPESPEGYLTAPWRLSMLALAMAVFGHLGRRIHAMQARVLSGAYTPAFMKWPAAPWLFVPAVALPVLVAVVQIGLPGQWDPRPQVWAPYLGALAVGLVAFSTGLILLYHLAGVFLSLGNIHLILTFWGASLRGQGLSDVHLVALGIAAALLQGSVIRRIVRKDEITRLINQSNLAWAGLILVLLSANYLIHPHLAEVTTARFAVSGAMSFLAGWYFRRAARTPAPGEELFAPACEGLYHFGVTMSFWCGALMIPALRHPIAALVALTVPVLYFYARAELGRRGETETFARYRVSAATVGFVVLAIYVLRGFVQMVVFPDVPFDPAYYHLNSSVVFVLGLVLLRLQALGGTSWLSFYGGLSVMGGVYFALTAFPGLSPFTHPVAGAWCALGLAHFFTLASVQRSPLRTAIQRLAAIDAAGWLELRRSWGYCLVGAAHLLVLLGCLEFSSQPRMVAPLIAGAATLLIHQGILRGSRLYSLVAQGEIALALHAGFLIPSFLHSDQVVWAILGLWTGLLAVQPLISRLLPGWRMGGHAAFLALMTAAHVVYHEPQTPAGLWAFGLGALLAALTPRTSRSPESAGETFAAAVLPWTPAWLVWFSQAPTLQAAVTPWPTLVTVATLFATGALASMLHRGWAEQYAGAARLRPRLYDQTLAWLGEYGAAIQTVLLWGGFAATLAVQAGNWGRPYTAREVALIELLYAGFAVAAGFEGAARKSMAPTFLLEVCVLAAYVVVRQQLSLTRGIWRDEYDVWASLAAFFALVGAKQVFDRQPREVRIPLRSMLLALPVFTVTWIGMHSMKTEMNLLAIGLHSAAFAYMGKEDRESPYHLVAVGGFIAFVLQLFWAKLQLTVAYAYVIPVGIGLLVVLQLFKGRVAPEVRNGVRTVVLLAMIGSAGFSALLDNRIPLLHHAVVMALSLAAMALGGLLHIRLYVALGFGSLMVDLAVIFVKAVAALERTARMTIVGSSVLALGAALVFGAIYYKTHKQEIGERLAKIRLRFVGWE